jgi:SAM-dependent methyltransferase
LALYLLTWVIAFSPRGRPLVRWASQAQDLAAVGALVLFLNQPYALAGPLLALVALVIVGLTQHGALAASAPEPGWLGRYYVLLAVGGALGTALVVLIGPALFPFPMETPLALAAAVALGRPQAAVSTSHGRLRFLAFGTVAMAVPLIGGVGREALLGSLAIGTGVAAMLWRGHPRRVALVLVGIVGLDLAVRLTAADLVATSHSILGRFAVRRDSSGVRLISGSTLHGLEPITPRGERPEAALYYTRRGPYGDVISLVAGRGTRWEFGVVGLGIGSLACTAPPGTKMTFFELNPGIVRLAHDAAIFRTLSSCAPGARIHLGDARLTLGTTSAQFDLLTIDAFNSDAIPTHLLTREALAVYRRRLKPGGIIAFHVSNRFLDLAPVVATVGADAGWVAVEAVPGPRRDPAGRVPTAPAADLVALAADSATLRPLVGGGRWRWRRSEGRPWTDDWTPLASALTLTRGNVFGK